MPSSKARPPFHRDGWVIEEKVDGWRIVAYKEGTRVRLISRNAVDHTRRFPGARGRGCQAAAGDVGTG